MEYEHEKGNTGHSPYMKLGILDHETYPTLEYEKRENMKWGTWNKVTLKFELGNLHLPLGSPKKAWHTFSNHSFGQLRPATELRHTFPVQMQVCSTQGPLLYMLQGI